MILNRSIFFSEKKNQAAFGYKAENFEMTDVEANRFLHFWTGLRPFGAYGADDLASVRSVLGEFSCFVKF